MMKTFLLTVLSVAWVSALQLQAQCVNDTTFTDVIYLVDNSGSIDDGEYISFESIITTSISSLQSTCGEAEVAVVHYGGFEGQELVIEHPFSTNPIPNVNRQFCNARDMFNICIGSGGDDLNHAIGAIIDSMATGALSHDTSNNLSLIILTDAFGFGTNCLQPNCSLILPIDNIDILKQTTGVDVTVVGVSAQAEESLLGIYASPGGDFMGPLFASECTGTFDGCAVPRKYIQAEFTSDPNTIANTITNTVSCQVQVVTGLTVEAGVDQSICTDLGQSAMLTATPSMGLAPFLYSWSSGETTPSITVSPTDTTLFFVTVTDANTCTFTDSVSVFAAPCCTGFMADAGADQTVCGNLAESATISATASGGTAPFSYTWDNGLGAGQTQTVTPTTTTTYTVTITDAIGCTTTDQVTVMADICCAGFSVNAGADVTVCGDLSESTTLTATVTGGLAPFTYLWSNGATLATQIVAPTTTTTFTVTVMDSGGCTTTDMVTVTAQMCCVGFAVDAGMDQIICGDLAQSATLNAVATGSGTSLITYNWDNGLGAGQSQTVSPATTTTYTVTAMSDIGCIDTDQVDVVVDSCCDGFSIDAGADQMICQGSGDIADLIAVTTGGVAPIIVTWNQGLGGGLAQQVSPFVTTTYTVTATDAAGCVTTDQITVSVEDCGPDCIPDTTFTDVIFLIDNSGSIDAGEFAAFENIIVESLAGIQASCPSSRRAVVHYGGANGTSTSVEFPLDDITITSVNRQFCTQRDQFGLCVGGGGDDLNNAIGDIMTFIGDGTLNRNPLNNLSLVILTDAFSFDDTCNQPNCSLILPTTNIDILKANFGADVSVIGVSEQAEESLLGIYASPGGDFEGPLFPSECAGTFDGCTVPRKYVDIEFNTPASVVAGMITDFVSCQVEVVPVIDVDAGPDQMACVNLGQSATLTATPSFGTPPFTYLWSDPFSTTTADLIVTPAAIGTMTFTVTVTDANTCTAVDTVVVEGIDCFVCDADAGTPQPPAEVCLDGGQAILASEPNDGVVIPAGFEEVFILANRDRTILDFSIGPRNFTVTDTGIFRIHTLIAEVTDPSSPDFFDLNTIEIGVSDLFFIVNCVENHEVCIAFDFPGRVFQVFGPEDLMCQDFENTINLCWDGFDNDGDGLVDCADPDCAEIITCLENTLIACNDLVDNDGDGLVDCFDPDCFQFNVCAERGEACEDGIDNDGDGLIDCADSSCDGSAPCLEDSPFTCVDGRDNDGDGLVDCADPQCANFIVCAEFDPVACRDGIDNDFDGLVDCADSDCRTVDPVFCEPFENNLEKCSDGRDNDFDGLIDCQDPDCQTEQLLAVLDNVNRIIEVENATCMGGDNGIIRFFGIAQDPSFQYSIDGGVTFISSIQFSGLAPGNYAIAIRSQFGCIEFFSVAVGLDACIEICNNNIDDDGDGLVDCDDRDCNIVEPFDPDIVNIVPSDCPNFNNGGFTVSGLPSNVTYSIDGVNFQTSPTFTGLQPISYNLRFQDPSGCHSGVIVTVPKGNDDDNDNICNEDDRCPGIDDWIIGTQCDDGDPNTENDLVQADCTCAGIPLATGEICGNGIDDDGDGLVDCIDADCCGMNACLINTIQFSTTGVNCNGTDGRIIISNFNPSTVYSLSPPATFNANSASFDNLAEGNYLVTASNACQNLSSDLIVISRDAGVECSEICDNGLDDDGDGLVDCADSDCRGDLTLEFEVTASDCNSATGVIEISNFDMSLEYVLTSAAMPARTAVASFFDNLAADDYTLFVINQCDTIANNIIVDEHECGDEICDNGLDDDGDGLVDCADSDCSRDLTLEFEVSASDCNSATGVIEISNFDMSLEHVLNSAAMPARTAVASFFDNLAADDYTLFIISQCDTISSNVIVGEHECGDEICDNNIDDDGDGLIDCIDSDCNNTLVVNVQTTDSGCDLISGNITVTNFSPTVEYILTPLNGGIEQSTTNGVFENLIPSNYVLLAIDNCNSTTLEISVSINAGCGEICDNDIDDDGDGLVDCDDPDCRRDFEVQTQVTPSDCDSQTGLIEILNFDASLEYVLTSQNMPARRAVNSFFDNLLADEYTLFTLSLCDTLANNILVTQRACSEICDNGLDDDGDGLLDCADEDCVFDEGCAEQGQGDCGPEVTLNFVAIESQCDSISGQIIITDYDPGLIYRLTGSGSTFAESQGTFSGLMPGTYDLSAANNCDSIFAEAILVDIVQGCTSGGADAPRTVEAAINVSLFLQGACVPEGGRMFTTLNDGGYLPGQQPETFFGVATPAGHPFGDAPWYYEGTEGLSSIDEERSSGDIFEYDEDVVDWILVSLRTSPEKDSEIWRAAGLLYSDGHVEFFDNAELPARNESYYILVEHRNHLPMMSHEQVEIVDGVIAYDFTIQDSHTSLLGIGQLQDDFGNYMMVAGNGELIIEISSDIDINARDLKMWIQSNGANSSYFLEDYDMNGDINIKDRIMWEKNNGLFTTLETK